MKKIIKAGIFLIFISLFFALTSIAQPEIVVKILSPANGATVGGIVPIVVQYTATGVSMSRIDSEPGGSQTFDPPVTYYELHSSFDTTSRSNGTQCTINAHAVGGEWVTGADSVTVTIYNPPPEIRITSLSDGQYISPDTTILPLTVEYNNVEPNYRGIYYVSFYASWGATGGRYHYEYTPSGTYTWNLNIDNLPLGNHWIMVHCNDSMYGSSEYITVNFNKKYSSPEDDITRQTDIGKAETVGEPINVANGIMFTTETDITVPANGMPLALSRMYNSREDFNGSFGYGWRSNYDITLTEKPDGSVIEADENSVYTIYTKNADSKYTPSAGKYSQLIKNADNTYLLIRKHGQKLYFDNNGKLVKIEDRNNNIINILRSSNGAILEVSESSGRKLIFGQDAQGRITQVTDPQNRVFKYEYDTAGNLIKAIDPLNNATLYQYDADHNLTRKTDANNHSVYFFYNNKDRAYHTYQDGNNNEVYLVYDPLNSTTQATDSLGNTTTYQYNAYGLVTRITDSLGNVQEFDWDENLNKTRATDPNNNTTFFTYDSRGNLTSVQDPLNNISTFTYEPNFDFISSATDALGNTANNYYDAQGNLIQATDAMGNVTNYSYDDFGRRIQATDANNNSAYFSYDTYGNLIRISDAQGNQKNFAYDLIGNVIRATDPRGNSTTFAYDLLNRLTQTTYADSSKTTSVYDAVGNLLSFTDQLGRVTTYTYDVADRLLTKTDALAATLTNAYDIEGNLTSVTDAKQQCTYYFYDKLNRLVKTSKPLTNPTLYNYDASGNLISETDAKNNTITHAYDANNRLIQTLYPDGKNVVITYDALGRKTAVTDASGTTSYAYDSLGRLTQSDGPEISDTISYSYDNVGNRIRMDSPDAGITSYAYDTLNRLQSITDAQGKVTTYAYDAAGNLINLAYPNNTQAVYTFDNLNRLISLVNKQSAATISSFNYTYNLAGMRTKATFANNDYINYTYDNINQLLSESRYSRRKKLLYSLSYTYDSVGNRLTENINISDTTFKIADYPLKSTLAYTYNNANQLTNLKVQVTSRRQTTIVKNTNYTYDLNGSLIQQNSGTGVINFAYDYENQLISVIGPQVNASYTYDSEGKRILQNEAGVVTKYLYDGMEVILEKDSANQKIVAYTRGLGYAGGIGGIISADSNSTSSYYHYDGLGSVTDLTDASGANVHSYTYEAFGNILQQSGTAANNYKFQTKEASSTTGLVYFGARYYNPAIGRWLTPDPLGMIDGPNVYVYLNNNPVNLIDPWGMCKGGWGSEFAKNLDISIAIAAGFYTQNQNAWVINGLVYTVADVLRGFSDIFRLGEGWAQGEQYWAQRDYLMMAASISQDVSRAASISAISLSIAQSLRPFWQYYPAGDPTYTSPYLTRGSGWSAPYEPGSEAYNALNLKLSKGPNPGTAVRPVEIKSFEPIQGKRPVQGGTGNEYYRGWRWPN